jgi:S-adenosyl methyltransferase
MAAMPSMAVIAKSVRTLLADIVQMLAADYGIRQFLDIGTGLPTADNTHEVAQRTAAESRVVYVDNDRCKSGCSHARWAGQATCGEHGSGSAQSVPERPAEPFPRRR